MTVSEKVAYLKGLADGLGIKDSTNEGKLMLAVIDVLEAMADDIEAVDAHAKDLSDSISDISEDMEYLEDLCIGDMDDDDEDYDEIDDDDDDDDEDEHEHHHHDHDEHDHDDHCCCGHHHDHDDDDDEHEHEHHHDHDEHDHDHEEHEHHHDHDGHCCCGHHHHDHHADEVFTSWGVETARKFTKAEVEHALTELDTGNYGMILRSKGIVDGGADGWLEFDYVPGEWEVRSRSADVGGKLVVIGSKLNETAIAQLFGC